MSGYIPFPTTAPEAARYLSAHYRMEVSEQKVRRVFDEIGDGLRAGPRGPRLIPQDMLDRIMETLEREGYVFAADVLAVAQAESIVTPPIAVACKPSAMPTVPPLSKPQDVVYSPVDERPQEKLGQQAQQPERSQMNHRGRRSTRR
jgi:hypothetical protein